MRSPLIRLAVGFLLLAACDGKKKYPTETSGSTLDTRQAPVVPESLPARVG